MPLPIKPGEAFFMKYIKKYLAELLIVSGAILSTYQLITFSRLSYCDIDGGLDLEASIKFGPSCEAVQWYIATGVALFVFGVVLLYLKKK